MMQLERARLALFALLGIVTFSLAATVDSRAQAARAPQRWYRGNTHTHTLNSDGNASPVEVVRWYRKNGYDFVVITDHEHVTDIRPLNLEFASPGQFLVLPGEEVTQKVADSTVPDRRRQAHVVAIGIDATILPLGERGLSTGTMKSTYTRNIQSILAAGGLAQINHPNFRWSVRPGDIPPLPTPTLFEVWNAHPWVNNLGGQDAAGNASLSTEALWDTLLTRGNVVFGIASDDAHEFSESQLQDPLATRPGGAWIMVRADTLTRESIVAALKSGNFYASTGVALSDYSAGSKRVEIQVAPPARPDDVRRFHIQFIGRGGKVLGNSFGRSASYTIRGNEGYVRATITDSNGKKAWTQPFFIQH